jgi:hypothetical protein
MEGSHFKIGDKVYRAKWDTIQEGEVVRTQRVSISNSGTSYEDVHGKYIEYIAKFGKDNWAEYVGQTYPWKFFSDKKLAYRRLAYEIEDRIDEYQKKIRELEDVLHTARMCSE